MALEAGQIEEFRERFEGLSTGRCLDALWVQLNTNGIWGFVSEMYIVVIKAANNIKEIDDKSVNILLSNMERGYYTTMCTSDHVRWII